MGTIEIHTDKDGKVYELTYQDGYLVSVKNIY